MKQLILLLTLAATLGACMPSPLRTKENQSILQRLRKSDTNQLLVMTLNLHTWQEKDARAKLDLVADLIATLQVDVVALQECAQHKDSPLVEGGIRSDNMALLITQRLEKVYHQKYYFYWDWAHYGWNVWEEGVAVLSRAPLESMESRVLSTANRPVLIDTRKAVKVTTSAPGPGKMQVVSAHLSWRKDAADQEANRQTQALLDFAGEKQDGTGLTLICGDFNAQSTKPAPFNEVYSRMTNAGYLDTYLVINPRANHLPPSSRYHSIEEGGRIDYIYLHGPGWQVQDSSLFFSFDGADRVSDHRAVLTLLQKTR